MPNLTTMQSISKKIVMLVDSSSIQNFITRHTLKEVSEELKIVQFNNTTEALKQLRRNQDNHAEIPDVILIDVKIDGNGAAEFIEGINQLSETVRKKCRIHLTSFDFDVLDTELSLTSPIIVSCLDKPLSREDAIKILA